MQAQSLTKDVGWIRSASFDLLFIVGIALLAIAGGTTAAIRPNWFALILLLDLWLLGYQHVMATFTRLTFDTESFREHKFLVLGLPILVIAGTVGIAYLFGTRAVTTTYLYWQWFHYTRQSYGIYRIYGRKAGLAAPGKLDLWMLYSLPLWGILYRSYQAPAKFLGEPVWTLPINLYVVYLAAAVSITVCLVWGWRQFKEYREGRFHGALFLYTVSHLMVFAFGYLLIENINYGWLVINIWHNAQYILIVWMYNNNRFRSGIDPKHWWLSMISQRRNVATYFLFCFAVSSLVYMGIAAIFPQKATNHEQMVVFSALIIYQAINFHHYIVDGVIWKVRKPKLQDRLGIQS